VVTLSSGAIDKRRGRLDAVRAEMRSVGIEALVLSQGADMPWLCGYTASPHERLPVRELYCEMQPPRRIALRTPCKRDGFRCSVGRRQRFLET
jgi:hypothetical protein